MVNKLLRQFIFATTMLFSAGHAWADLVIVTSEATGISTLSKEDVINIYLGRYRRLPNALPALPIDMAESSEIKKKNITQFLPVFFTNHKTNRNPDDEPK